MYVYTKYFMLYCSNNVLYEPRSGSRNNWCSCSILSTLGENFRELLAIKKFLEVIPHFGSSPHCNDP